MVRLLFPLDEGYRASAGAGAARITEEEESFYDAALVVRSASAISRASAQSAFSARSLPHLFVPTVHVLAVLLSTPDPATVVLGACRKQECWPATAAACVPACSHQQLLDMKPRFQSSFRDAFHALQAVTTAKHLRAGNTPLESEGWSAGWSAG